MKSGISTKYKLESYYIGGLLIVLVSLVLFSFWRQSGEKKSETAVAMREVIMPMKAVSEGDNFRWKNNSRYSLVIYTSLDCDHCKKLFHFIESRYELFGNAFNLIYRNAPLTDIEPLAIGKAVIGECLRTIEGNEKYFQFITEMYTEYNLFQKNNDWVYEVAKKLTKKQNELKSCIDGDTIREQIGKERIEALSDGVSSTPTLGIFFDNELVGRYSVSGLKAMQIVEYLSLFSSKADQFWSEGMLENYLQKYEASQ